MVQQRCSIAFQEKTWERLQNESNITKTVNAAVEFYLAAKDHLKNEEDAFILRELSKYIPRGKRPPDPSRSVSATDTFNY